MMRFQRCVDDLGVGVQCRGDTSRCRVDLHTGPVDVQTAGCARHETASAAAGFKDATAGEAHRGEDVEYVVDQRVRGEE